MAASIVDRVRPLALLASEQNGVDLWDVEFLKEGSVWVLRVSIDRPGGIDTDACEAVSRALDPMLDDADPIPQSYVLEVSSAGVERVLRGEDDYLRYAGEYVEVRLFSAIDGRKELFGILDGFDAVSIKLDGGISIPRNNISQIRLRLKF